MGENLMEFVLKLILDKSEFQSALDALPSALEESMSQMKEVAAESGQQIGEALGTSLKDSLAGSLEGLASVVQDSLGGASELAGVGEEIGTQIGDALRTGIEGQMGDVRAMIESQLSDITVPPPHVATPVVAGVAGGGGGTTSDVVTETTVAAAAGGASSSSKSSSSSSHSSGGDAGYKSMAVGGVMTMLGMGAKNATQVPLEKATTFEQEVSLYAANNHLTPQQQQVLTQKVLQARQGTPFTPEQVMDTVYLLNKRGYEFNSDPSKDTLTPVLNQTMRGAFATGVDPATFATTTSHLGDAYGMVIGKSASQVSAYNQRMSDTITTLQGHSAMTVNDLPNMLNYIGTAKEWNNGKGMDPALFMTLMATAQSTGASRKSASQGLNSLMLSTLKPSKQQIAQLDELNSSSYAKAHGIKLTMNQSEIDKMGFDKWINQVYDVAMHDDNGGKAKPGGNASTEIDRLFGNKAAFNFLGHVASPGAGQTKFNQLWGAVQNSQGSTDKAYQDQMQNPINQLAIQQAQLQAAQTQFGINEIPAMTQYYSLLSNILGLFNKAPTGLQKVIVDFLVFGGALARVVGPFAMFVGMIQQLRLLGTLKSLNNKLGGTGAEDKAALAQERAAAASEKAALAQEEAAVAARDHALGGIGGGAGGVVKTAEKDGVRLPSGLVLPPPSTVEKAGVEAEKAGGKMGKLKGILAGFLPMLADLGPEGWIAIAVIGALGGAVALLATHWKQVNQWMKKNAGWNLIDVWKGIVKVFHEALPVLKKIGEEIWKFLKPVIIFYLKAWALEFKLWWMAVQEAWKIVKPIFEALWHFLATTVFPAISNAVKTLVKTWKEYWPEIKQVLQEVWQAIGPIIMAGVHLIEAIWKPFWGMIGAVLKIAWDNIVFVIKLAWHIISGIIKVALDLLTGHWGKAWTDFKNIFINVWKDIKGWFGNIEQDLFNFGANLVKMLVNGIKSLASSVWDEAKNIGKGIEHWLGFHSPSKGLPDSDKWMPNMMQMFAKGIKDNAGLVSDALSKVIDPNKMKLSASALASLNGGLVVTHKHVVSGEATMKHTGALGGMADSSMKNHMESVIARMQEEGSRRLPNRISFSNQYV